MLTLTFQLLIKLVYLFCKNSDFLPLETCAIFYNIINIPRTTGQNPPKYEITFFTLNEEVMYDVFYGSNVLYMKLEIDL